MVLLCTHRINLKTGFQILLNKKKKKKKLYVSRERARGVKLLAECWIRGILFVTLTKEMKRKTQKTITFSFIFFCDYYISSNSIDSTGPNGTTDIIDSGLFQS